MESVLDKCLTPTTDMIIQLVEIENAHINTNHPDFVGSADVLLSMFQQQEEQQPNENQYSSEDNQKKNFSLLNKKSGNEGKGMNGGKGASNDKQGKEMIKASVGPNKN